MFALKSWTEIIVRALLIAVIVINALIPTTVIALSSARNNEVNSSPLPSRVKGSAVRYHTLSLRSPTVFQDGTPTVFPVETVTETPKAPPENIPTTTETTPTSVSTLEATPAPSITEPTTQSPTATNQAPVLSFKLSATPEQAAPGDQITFTVEIMNNGQVSATGLLFSNRPLAKVSFG